MARAAIEFIIGAVILGLGIWWYTIIGPSFAFLLPLTVMGIGGAVMVAGFSNFLNTLSPTSRKL